MYIFYSALLFSTFTAHSCNVMMKSYAVLYYSKTGNSKFLAERLAQLLECPCKPILPSVNRLLPLFMLSNLKVKLPIGISQQELAQFDEIVMIGPIWGGLLIAPLRTALKKCIKAAKPIHFAVSCETSDEAKNDKYGYAHVLQEAKMLGGNLVKTTEAFPTTLAKGSDATWHPKLSEKVKITEENFEGALASRLANFAQAIQTPTQQK